MTRQTTISITQSVPCEPPMPGIEEQQQVKKSNLEKSARLIATLAVTAWGGYELYRMGELMNRGASLSSLSDQYDSAANSIQATLFEAVPFFTAKGLSFLTQYVAPPALGLYSLVRHITPIFKS